jgi:nitroimidazol reductase NimA-like FMN-containing flavoprotein (pyridoxamine 5'-phosphate oxidase superfamily)
MGTPPARRPHMPGYGIEPADGGTGLLPWSWATERLIDSHSYWLSTVGPTGAPHAMPVWAVWIDDHLVLSTGGRSRKARNLTGEPRCVVTTERTDEPVVVEGNARRITEPGELAAALEAYAAKYGSEPPDPDDNPLIAVDPEVVFGLCAAEDRFTTSPTRWQAR